MGVMTGRAFCLLHGCVDISPVQSNLLSAMTIIADFVSLLFQQQVGNDAVAEVAGLAVSLLNNRVHVFHPEVLICKFLVTVEALLANKRPLLCPRGFACRKENRSAQEEEYREKYRPIFCCMRGHHVVSLFRFRILTPPSV